MHIAALQKYTENIIERQNIKETEKKLEILIYDI